jgi:NAD(P)H dehydrogenase (quinone)
MTPGPIGLTGSTGALGSLVATALSDLSPTLIVRDPARAPALRGGRIRQASYGDRAAARSALEGIETLFMVSGAEAVDRRDQHRAFISTAAEAGVRHLVYTSFSGAAADATFTLGRDHADAEDAIRQSGMDFTILRDNFYADILPLFADAAGVIRGPAGEGRVAAVGRVDVAAVAAVVLREPSAHTAMTYTLTGPEALTLSEIAARAGAALGRHLRFVDESEEAAYAWRLAEYGAERWQLDAWVSTYTAIRDGSVAAVTDDVRRVTGAPAQTLEQVLAR